MKTLSTILLIACCYIYVNDCAAQEKIENTPKLTRSEKRIARKAKNTQPPKTELNSPTQKPAVEDIYSLEGKSVDNYGWGKRISFIAGAGASYICNNLYYDPIIDKTTNSVIIEKAGHLKPNITLGIIYTPKVSSITRKIKVIDEGKIKNLNLIEYYPKGWSYALFINPLSVTKLSSVSMTNTVDLGFGFGYRSGGVSILATAEIFSIRQPKDYFIKQYKSNNKPYVLNDEIQSGIDINDNSIFNSKVIVSFGIKLCYTFDIVRSFVSDSGKE